MVQAAKSSGIDCRGIILYSLKLSLISSNRTNYAFEHKFESTLDLVNLQCPKFGDLLCKDSSQFGKGFQIYFPIIMKNCQIVKGLYMNTKLLEIPIL